MKFEHAFIIGSIAVMALIVVSSIIITILEGRSYMFLVFIASILAMISAAAIIATIIIIIEKVYKRLFRKQKKNG